MHQCRCGCSNGCASWRIWIIGFAVVLTLGVFLAVAEDVWMKEGLAWDAPIMLVVHQWRAPWLNALMLGVTDIGSPGVFVIAPAIALWLWRRQRPRAAVTLLVSGLGAALLSSALKVLFARPRPAVFPPLIAETSYSFPSGHALNAIAFYGFIAYLLWQQRQRGWAVAASFFALSICFSRIYLGVHYPSDIVGAISIGLLWLGFVIGGYQHYQAHGVRIRKMPVQK
ncbi:MAG: phosphatase PAP2 family protein [Caldilineaceae bacterium]